MSKEHASENSMIEGAAKPGTPESEELYAVRMLNLKLPTDPRWVNLTEKNLEEILTDHAYCEQKAASTCISLIQGYPEKEKMVEELAPIVTEEWGHFRQVLRKLKEHNLKLGRQRKDEYVRALFAAVPKGLNREDILLEKLLVAGLIEARSCERFRLLSLHLKDEALRKFYHGFMVSEAGHYVLFLDLARSYFGEERVNARWKEWLALESDIMDTIGVAGDRMH